MAKHGIEHGLGRALRVVDLLTAAGSAGVRPSVLARDLDVAPSTVGRILPVLVTRGYAERLPNGRYVLGATPIAATLRWLGPVVQAVAPTLARLAGRTGGLAHAAVLQGTRVVIIARSGEPALAIRIPSILPAWATAAGRALLGTRTALERARLLPPEPYTAYTERTATSASALAARLREGRERGLFVGDRELYPELYCVAVAVELDGQALAVALTVRVTTPEADRRRFEGWLIQAGSELALGTG